MESKNNLKGLVILQLLLIGIKNFAQTPSDTCKPVSVYILLKGQSVILTPKGKAKLDSVCIVMKNYPLCKIRVESYGYANEGDQQISWDKVETVVRYFRKKGINEKNFVLSYGMQGNPDMVNIASTTEEGLYYIPAPIPCYSLHLPRKKRCVDKRGHFLH